MSAGRGAGVQTWAQREDRVRRVKAGGRLFPPRGHLTPLPTRPQAGRAGECPGQGLHSWGLGPVSSGPNCHPSPDPASLKQGGGTWQEAAPVFLLGTTCITCVAQPETSLRASGVYTWCADHTGHTSPGCPRLASTATSAAPASPTSLAGPVALAPKHFQCWGREAGPRAKLGKMCLSTGCLGEDERPGPAPHTSQLPSLQIPAQDPLSQSQPLRIKDKSHTCFRNSDHKTGALRGPEGREAITGQSAPSYQALLPCQEAAQAPACGCDPAVLPRPHPSRPCSQALQASLSGTFEFRTFRDLSPLPTPCSSLAGPCPSA